MMGYVCSLSDGENKALEVCCLPFWTLSQSKKISSPPSTEPHVLSMREIFRLEALGDSVGGTDFDQS